MRKAAPIINRPSAVSMPSRLGWQVVAVLMWTCWISCWAPLLTLAVWEFGLYQLHRSLIATDGLSHFQQTIAVCGPIVALQCALMLSWAGKEHFFYELRQRRQPTPAVDLAELAHFGQLPQQRLAFWQGARRITAEHDDYGRLRWVRLPESKHISARYRGALATVASVHLHSHLSLVVTPVDNPAHQRNTSRTIPAMAALADVCSC